MTQQNCRIDLVKPENKKSFAAKSDRSDENVICGVNTVIHLSVRIR
jgi:hypothetical protein